MEEIYTVIITKGNASECLSKKLQAIEDDDAIFQGRKFVNKNKRVTSWCVSKKMQLKNGVIHEEIIFREYMNKE